jgi:predicted peptidase
MPSNYESSSKTYPLLLFLAGAGQFGDGNGELHKLLNDGPAKLVQENKLPGTFTVNRKTFSFIILTPQFKTHPSFNQVKDFLNFAMANYRIDASRVYLSGLSLGGILTTETAADIPGRIAAIVPMAGVMLDYATTNKAQVIANNNIPVWSFHSQDDGIIPVNTTTGFVSKLNSYNPFVRAKVTLWPSGGHDAWTRALEPGYKEDGLNIYEWMLQFKK